MTQAADSTRSLMRLLKQVVRARGSRVPDVPDAADPVAVLVLSFLAWEATIARALAGYRRVRETVVDFNDLRVCLPHETVAIIGERYPAAQERCQRIRASLNDLYLREHAVSFDRVQQMGKREIKRYVDSLEGMVPYVSARVCLLCFDVHGIPVDEALRRSLIDESIADPATNVDELAASLTRHVHAADGVPTYWALQMWSDRRNGARLGKSGAGRAGGSGSRRSGGPATRTGGDKKPRRRAGRTAGTT